jgi:cystathionine beta-lyase family protein involved in aluminum resistance
MEVSGKLDELARSVEEEVRELWPKLEELNLANQARILDAFGRARVSSFHLQGSTGYGYNDHGREVLDNIYADIFGAEAALVRGQVVSGTHAIALCLYGVLRPGDELLSLQGSPYDTLQEMIGIRGDKSGCLAEFGINYRQVNLSPGELLDPGVLKTVIGSTTRMVLLQRSRGYSLRPPLGLADMREVIRNIKDVNREVVILVDNCYGEFVEDHEPTQVGADLVAGSLIKNPGGGLAPTGGYVAGRRGLVEAAANRLTAPGIAGEVGPTLSWQRLLLQGLFLAPGMVCQSLKGMVFASKLFQHLGFEVEPAWDGPRTDIIQAITLGSPERLVGFCRGIQSRSPVDSHVRPEPWNMPGYGDQVVMAAGTFVQGASLELTADAPLRNPYTVFLQGGLSYHHVKLAVLAAAQEVIGIG